MISVKEQNGIAVIQFENPKKLNALNADDLRSTLTELKRLDKDKSVRVIIITGKKVFSAGGDMAEMVHFNKKLAGEFAKLGKSVVHQIMRSSKPVIAAVERFAIGGGAEIMAVCDIVVAGKSAKFGQPEAKVGIIPGFGGTQSLRRIVGSSKAKELILCGTIINSKEAHRLGLFNEVVANGRALAHAKKIAKKLSGYPSNALAMAKKMINQSWNPRFDQETRAFAECFGAEQKKRMRKFLKK